MEVLMIGTIPEVDALESVIGGVGMYQVNHNFDTL
jgi:hypothetical protein